MILKNAPLSLLVSTAILTSAMAAQAATVDNLHLKNGDRLSGAITAYTSDSVTIDTAYGVLTVPVSTIGGVTSPRVDMATILRQEKAPIATAAPTDIVAQAPVVIDTTQNIASIAPASGDVDAAKTGLWGASWSGDANVGLEIERAIATQKHTNWTHHQRQNGPIKIA